jgi:hypothetical protein
MSQTNQTNNRAHLTDQEIDAILDRVLLGDLTLEEAQEEIDRLFAVHRQATVKLLSMLGAASVANREAVIVLLGALGDADAVQPLLALIRQETFDDDDKLKLISLVAQFDPRIDLAALFDHLQSPLDALQRSQQAFLRLLASPGELALWLDMMVAHMSPKVRAGLCQIGLELDDAAAVALLICMCYDPDDDVALTAIDAVERYKDARALPALQELADYHPSRTVRIEARKAADRLGIRATLVPQVESTPLMPLFACYLTTIDGAGEQMAIIVRDHPDETLEWANVMFDDRDGIVQCFGSYISVKELADVLETFSEQYISPVAVSHSFMRNVLDLAVQTTWNAERVLPMSFVAWRRVIEGDDGVAASDLPTLSLPLEGRDDLFEHCYELLFQDEFIHWLFNADEIGDLGDRYLSLLAERAPTRTAGHRAGSAIDASALRHLLCDGVREIVDDHTRKLIRSRLLRSAPLLRELYEEDEVWQWAVVAADALDENSPLSVNEHPFLLGMVACSLENAIGETIEWADDRVVARRA